MNHGNAFSTHTFFPTGDPGGLRIVKKDNWSGRAIAFSRDRMSEVIKDGTLESTGIYVLHADEGDHIRIYVGESGQVIKRLKTHSAKMDFWTDAVAFVRMGDSLDKADVEYLEARLIQLARSAMRSEVENDPRKDRDPESMLEPDKKAANESFLEDMLQCLRSLNIPEFEQDEDASHPPTTESVELSEPRSPSKECDQRERILKVKKTHVHARGHLMDNCLKFRVFQGAQVAKDEVPSLADRTRRSSRKLRHEMIEDERLVLDTEANIYVLQVDYDFDSASQAEQVIAGRPGSGLQNWQLTDEAKDDDIDDE